MEKNLKNTIPSYKIVKELFGDKFDSIVFIPKPFTLETKCMDEDCQEIARLRAYILCNNQVYEIRTCDKHFEKFNGKEFEIFPVIKII